MQPEQKQERILIAAAADQPAAQRAIALDTGMTIADYFRGMGCDAVVIVDDLSRWADALRVLSAELGEQTAAAGYPADLASRLAFCFARAGEADGGSVTLIAAAADRDDPVQDALMRCAGAVWTMDDTMQLKWAQRCSLLMQDGIVLPVNR